MVIRSATSQFDFITLVDFARQYTMPKRLNTEPKRRNKKVVVIARPYCSPDPDGPTYEQYCLQSLMQQKCFRQMSDLTAGYETFAEAYAVFLQSHMVPTLLQNDIFRLQQQANQPPEDSYSEVHVCNVISSWAWDD